MAARRLNLIVPGEHLSIAIAADTEQADLFNTSSRNGLGYALLQASARSRPL